MEEHKYNQIAFLNVNKIIRESFLSIYWLIGIMTIVLSSWAVYFFTVDRIFEVKSMIKVAESSNSSSSIDEILSTDTSINLDEQISLYKSYTNRYELTDELGLNISIDGKTFIPAQEKKIIFEDVLIAFDEYVNYKEFKFELSEDELGSKFRIFENEEVISSGHREGDKVVLPGLIFTVAAINTNDEEVNVQFKRIERSMVVAGGLRLNKQIDSRNPYLQGNLIEVSYVTSEPEFGIELIDNANKIFITKSIERTTEDSAKSLVFLAEQIENIERDLQESTLRLNKYRNQFSSIDINKEIELNLNRLNDLDSQILKINIDIEQAKSLYKESNPLIKSLESQKNTLEDQKEETLSFISALPKTEQKLIELLRDVEINRDIYENLVQKEIEVSIVQASSLGGVQIIDNAYISERVSPKGFQSLVSSLVFGLVICFLFIIAKIEFFSRVNLPSEIYESSDMSAIGVIPESDESEKRFNESINTYISNLLLKLQNFKKDTEGKIIQIIGATQGVGKSFVSYHTAKNLSGRGSKVLLIDFDLKKGKLIDYFSDEIKNRFKHKSNLYGEGFAFEDFKVDKNLYFVPRQRKSGDDALKILDSADFINFLKRAKLEFDYIVFDTPPSLLLSDAIYLSRYSDIIIPVFRHLSTTIRDVKSLEREYEQSKHPLSFFVYNAFRKPTGYYSYDYYSYKYYGGYDYDYDSEDK